MTGSFQIARVFDIPVKLHWTFGLLILWVGGSGLQAGFSSSEILIQVAFVLALFFCVVLHEYGHALTARRFGVNTRDIILSPIGGIARLDKLPEKPIQEFLVAIAGPAVNVAIAILLLPYFFIFSGDDFLEKIQNLRIFEDGIDFIPGLILLNVILAAFNMLPAFPMDGGRILRALLSLKMTRLNATRVASYIGQFFAVLFIFAAINNGESWITGLIGVFIFFTAGQELEAAKMEKILNENTASELARPTFTKLIQSEKMQVPADFLKRSKEKNFLVFEEDNFTLLGSLSEASITKAIKSDDLESPIFKYTRKSQIPGIYSVDSLKTVYEKLYLYPHPILPILKEGRIAGVIDDDLIDDFLKARRKAKR